MRWVSHDHVTGTVCAVGARGMYVVARVGEAYVVAGCGHDGRVFHARAFTTLGTAQWWACQLDQASEEQTHRPRLL